MSGTESDLVFVTGEEKSGWWHKGGGSTILPRLELIDDYRQVPGGGTLHLSSLAGLLEAMEANSEVVTEVRESRGWVHSVDPNQTQYVRIFENRVVLMRGADGLAAALPVKQWASTAAHSH
jgi:hypothetical protein